jgi:predicted Zn-dependent peptidase
MNSKITHKPSLFFFLLVFLCCYATSIQAFSLQDKVHEFELQNGLKILLMPRHQSPTVSFSMRFKVGSIDESSGSTGVAHVLEHMLFKGTKTLGTNNYEEERKILDKIDSIAQMIDNERRASDPVNKDKIENLEQELTQLQQEHKKLVMKDEIDNIYSRNGAVGFNASTGNDLTTYTVSLPANRIELWTRIESDRLLNPVLREFYSERDVVLEELRQSYETKPDRIIMSQFLQAAFTVHPYRRPIIGWKSDLQFLSKKRTAEFFKSHYAPNNAVLAIVGDIQPEETIAMIKRYFGQIPSQPIPVPTIADEPKQIGERQIQVVLDAEPQLLIGYHKPTIPDFADYVFDVISALLSNGRTSRLYKALVTEKKIAASVYTVNGFPGARYPNLFFIKAIPLTPHTHQEIEDAIYHEIDRLKRESISERDLQKIKNQLQASFLRSLQSNAHLASQLSYYQIIADDWAYLEKHMEIIAKITPEDIRQTAKEYFNPENRTVAQLVKKIPNRIP